MKLHLVNIWRRCHISRPATIMFFGTFQEKATLVNIQKQKCVLLLQKRAVRIIDNVGYRDHTSIIFKKYRLLKLVDIVYYQTYILMYKANQGNLPVKIQLKFKKIKTFIGIIQGLRITFLQGKILLKLVKCL